MDEPDVDDSNFLHPWQPLLHEVFPRMHDIQSEWLAALEGLTALDRKTNELVRLALCAARRNRAGVEHHARLAAEVGATWAELCEAILLTQPSFGVLGAVEALPVAHAAMESAEVPETD